MTATVPPEVMATMFAYGAACRHQEGPEIHSTRDAHLAAVAAAIDAAHVAGLEGRLRGDDPPGGQNA